MTVESAWVGRLSNGFAGLAMLLAVTPPAAAQQLVVGFIAPMTGRFAQVGRDMVNGFEMYLDEVKGDFAGTKVKLILEDDQARPPTGVLKAEKLIRQDKVHILMGGVLATTGYCAGSSEHAREDDIYTGCSCCR